MIGKRTVWSGSGCVFKLHSKAHPGRLMAMKAQSGVVMASPSAKRMMRSVRVSAKIEEEKKTTRNKMRIMSLIKRNPARYQDGANTRT